MLRLLRRDDPFGRAERKDEPGTRGTDVECGRVLGAENRLQIAGLRGQEPVR